MAESYEAAKVSCWAYVLMPNHIHAILVSKNEDGLRAAGIYETEFGKFPRLQILTVEDLFNGKRPQIPFGHSEGYKKAAKETKSNQGKLL